MLHVAHFHHFVEVTVFEDIKTRPGDKRKREKGNDPSDIESYKGENLFCLLSWCETSPVFNRVTIYYVHCN